MAEPTTHEVQNAVLELKALVLEGRIDPDKKARLDNVLDQYETKNQEITAAQQNILGAQYEIQTLKNELEEKGINAGVIRERMDAMEAEFARRSANRSDPDAYRDTPEFKALNKWCAVGDSGIDLETKALLRTDSAVDGGTLVLNEMDSEITKKITEIDQLRSVARVRTIGSKGLEVPIRTGIPTAVYEGEAETGTDSTSAYGSETLTPYRQTFTVPVTKDMLMDSSFNMEQEITQDASEAFAFGEGQGFITGTGFKEPQGITVDATVVAAALTASSGGLTDKINPVDLIVMAGELKVGYNPVYVMHRRTFARLRSERVGSGFAAADGAGGFLWNPAMDSASPATINGFPYILSSSMPQEADQALSVAFGDFRRGYTIVDRTGISIVRDEFTLKRKAVVEFTLNRWNTGQVTLPEAIILQKCE
jgi:HK97 family phage major capsid protein